MLRSLTNVLIEHQMPAQNRWAPGPMYNMSPSRVVPASTSRVGNRPTTSVDTTALEAIRTTSAFINNKNKEQYLVAVDGRQGTNDKLTSAGSYDKCTIQC